MARRTSKTEHETPATDGRRGRRGRPGAAAPPKRVVLPDIPATDRFIDAVLGRSRRDDPWADEPEPTR